MVKSIPPNLVPDDIRPNFFALGCLITQNWNGTMLTSYSMPYAPSGKASILPAPPWHFSGDFLVVEFRADPDVVKAHLPSGFDLGEDPGICTFVFGEYQSCSDGFEELVDPASSQYKEAYILADCTFKGRRASRCLFIWVDRDFSLYRGYVQGYPKKIGEIDMTRHYSVGRATPQIAAGGRFGAAVSYRGRSLARSSVELKGKLSRPPRVQGAPIVNTRHFPSLTDPSTPAIEEAVSVVVDDVQYSEIWEGPAQLKFYEDTLEDLAAFGPLDVERGMRYSMGASVKGGTLVE